MAAEHALGGTGFGYHDFREQGQAGDEPVPNPEGNLFAGGVFESGDLVEVAMVELFPERTEGGGDVGVVDQPAEVRIAGARHREFNLEAVAMQPPAFVVRREFGQEMGRFKLKGFS